MPFRHGHVSAAESLSEIGTVDKTKGNNTGHHRVDIDLLHADGIRHAVKCDLQAVKDQQHQHQVRHAANQRGIAFKYQRQRSVGG